MDDEKLLQIADDQLNFLDRMSALHQRRMLDSIQALERRIVDRASALKTSESGNLLGAKTNLTQAQKVHSDMTALFDEEYGAASRETVKEYSESLPVIQQQYEDMGEAVKYTGVDRDMVKALKTQDLAAYASYGLAAQDKIAKAVYNHVIAQAPFSALVGEIAAALTGQKDKRGRPLANYAKQMANDGIMNFHNTVNLKKAEDAKFEHYLYVGNIIADSRPFCIARAGNVYTREQIDSWTGPWQGKSGPAFTHRGGYNCRHHWQPTRKEWIPEGGIEVQSWFDRAGVMPVSKLPKSITGAPKFKAWQAWQQSVLIGKKPLDAAAVAKAAGVPKSAASGWLSQWQRGYNLPQGWQSVVRDLEAKAGGFETVVEKKMPGVPMIVEMASSVETADDLHKFAKFVRFADDDNFEYFTHAVRHGSEIDSILENGIQPGSAGKLWASKPGIEDLNLGEIRNRGQGWVVFRAKKGLAVEGIDFVEPGLSYKEYTFTEKIMPHDIVKVVRTHDGFDEMTIARNMLRGVVPESDIKDGPEVLRKWFKIASEDKRIVNEIAGTRG